MQAILDTTRGLSVLATLTWDRAMCLGAVALALLAGAGLGSMGAG